MTTSQNKHKGNSKKDKFLDNLDNFIISHQLSTSTYR